MIDSLIRFSVQQKAVIGLLVLGLIAWGLYALSQLPIDAVPDITNNQIQVVTVSPTLAPQEMEQYVTFPVELNMANIPGVTEVRSVSKYGLSVVTVVFEDEVPTLDARQLVNEQIQKVQTEIPAGFGSPEMMPITTGLGEIFQYVLEPQAGYEDQFDAIELRTIHDWIVKRYLAGIEGIVETSSFGGFVKQYEVSVDPLRLRALDLTLNEVYAALEANNANTGGSYLEKEQQAFYIRAEGLLQTKAEIEQVPIALRNDLPVLVRDVAQIRDGHLPRFGTMTRNGKGETVGGITLMLKGANSNTVIAAVKDRIQEVEKVLPEGLKIVPFLDRAALVQRTIGTVRTNLIEGGLIVVFVLVVLLGNWRAGLVVASVIPLALLFAFGMMHVFGVSANLMSLGAIDFGLIVDGAVILVESVVHRLQSQFKGQSLSRQQMDEEVITATSRIRSSAAFGELIILMVYLPLLALSGIEGKMFTPMAQTVGFAILGALILSMTYVPMASALFLSRKQSEKLSFADKLIAALQNAYQPLLKSSLARPAWIVGLAVLAFGASMWLFSRMGGEFIPQLEEGDLAMQMSVPAGSALSHTVAMSTRAEKILLASFPEVLQVVSKIGSSEIPTDPMSVEDADVMIIMKEKEAWTTTQDRNELVALMAEALEPLEAEGAGFEFTQPIELRFNELLTGSKADVAVKIYGDDLSELAAQAEEAAELIRAISGAADVKVDRTEGFPQIVLRYRRAQMARYGVSVAQVNQTVQTAFAGGVAGVVFEGERRFDLVVRLQPNARKDLSDIAKLQVRLADGHQVPIRELAEIGYAEGPMQISRDDTKRQITIGVNVRERDLESVVADIQSKLEAGLALPPGYALRYGGEFENLESARSRLLITVPIVLFLILVMLYFTFGSFVQALLIFSAIPMAAIGGVLGLWLRDMPFSISAGVGFIALFGVAVLNGIVLIAYFNRLREESKLSLLARIQKGASVRMRPVLMTAAVASLGFLPMAISNSAGAEVQRPLATVVIGGLISATLLTLFVLPSLYYLIEKRKN
ncbi:MAG: CusA/CzcA family heavy metal efflux RND transporter [Bacteroidota bacterium]